MSATPRTDAEEFEPGSGRARSLSYTRKFVTSDFARELERELASATQSAKDSMANFRSSEVNRIEAERERDQLRTRVALIQADYDDRCHTMKTIRQMLGVDGSSFEQLTGAVEAIQIRVAELDKENENLGNVMLKVVTLAVDDAEEAQQ